MRLSRSGPSDRDHTRSSASFTLRGAYFARMARTLSIIGICGSGPYFAVSASHSCRSPPKYMRCTVTSTLSKRYGAYF